MQNGLPGVVEGRESAKPAQGRLKAAFWLDVALLASVCRLQTVTFTRLIVHEWLGLSVCMVLAHLLLSWSWIASLSRRLFTIQPLGLFAAVTAEYDRRRMRLLPRAVRGQSDEHRLRRQCGGWQHKSFHEFQRSYFSLELFPVPCHRSSQLTRLEGEC